MSETLEFSFWGKLIPWLCPSFLIIVSKCHSFLLSDMMKYCATVRGFILPIFCIRHVPYPFLQTHNIISITCLAHILRKMYISWYLACIYVQKFLQHSRYYCFKGPIKWDGGTCGCGHTTEVLLYIWTKPSHQHNLECSKNLDKDMCA